ncbi:hypothetical protein LTR36_006047 [Oleoguttula mirabilis]|uniref:Uncharacterized protein n=1 Tax=Oleoguttula mirabilis TaxID=1507867 RepID=A0AAV9JDJ7_9PEZI|nr:hypothetical protein LTR36_006047 [Oleoguttula mirabilis]
MDESMHEFHKKGQEDKKNRDEAEHIAQILLSYADLPLVFRCRALMIMGCSEKPGYVEWAKEAVRFAELGTASAQGPLTEGDQQLLANCKTLLEQAEEDYAERGGYDDGQGDVDEDTGDEDEGEVIWDSTNGWVNPADAEAEDDTDGAVERKTTAVVAE